MFGSLTHGPLINTFLGVTLLVFGVLFLLSNYGVIPAVQWDKIWPLILILLGATFLLRSTSWGGPRDRGYWG